MLRPGHVAVDIVYERHPGAQVQEGAPVPQVAPDPPHPVLAGAVVVTGAGAGAGVQVPLPVCLSHCPRRPPAPRSCRPPRRRMAATWGQAGVSLDGN